MEYFCEISGFRRRLIEVFSPFWEIMPLNIPEGQRPLAIFLFPGKEFLAANKKSCTLFIEF
jgi:hypothetical protein